jgi:hypothetical protein
MKMQQQMAYRPTDLTTVPQIIEELNQSFRAGITKPVTWRKDQLRRLWHLVNVKLSTWKLSARL